MRLGPLFILLSFFGACCSGCLIVPIPYLHPTFIPEQDVSTTDEVIVTKTVLREKHRLLGVPCYPYETEERCVSLVEVPASKIPEQWPLQPEFFNFVIAPSMLMMLPLPGYVWEHDTLSLQVYRRGYQTNTIKNWQHVPLVWVPANSWEEREMAIDRLLFAEQPTKMLRTEEELAISVPTPLESIDNRCWFQKKERWIEKENTKRETDDIKNALRRIAAEYQALESELSQAPQSEQVYERVASKRKQLLCLANCLVEKPEKGEHGLTKLPSIKEPLAEVAIGSPNNIQLAATILQKEGINHYISADGDLFLYVSASDYDLATSLLLCKRTQFQDRMMTLREPTKLTK